MNRTTKIGLAAAVAGLVVLLTFHPWNRSQEQARLRAALSGQPNHHPSPAPGPLIGYIETRDYRIALYPNDTYTVSDKSGKVIADKATLDDLQASNPTLRGILERAVAETGSSPSPLETRDNVMLGPRRPPPIMWESK